MFFNPSIKYLGVLKEFKSSNKPIIVLGNISSLKNKLVSDYLVNLNLQCKNIKQLCSFIVYSSIKKI